MLKVFCMFWVSDLSLLVQSRLCFKAKTSCFPSDFFRESSSSSPWRGSMSLTPWSDKFFGGKPKGKWILCFFLICWSRGGSSPRSELSNRLQRCSPGGPWKGAGWTSAAPWTALLPQQLSLGLTKLRSASKSFGCCIVGKGNRWIRKLFTFTFRMMSLVQSKDLCRCCFFV